MREYFNENKVARECISRKQNKYSYLNKMRHRTQFSLCDKESY
jgi:hypothetical protein